MILAVSLLAAVVGAASVRRSGTSTEEITYITPIWEGALANHSRDDDLAVLSDMKSMLGIGGTFTKLGWSFSSWALSRDIDSGNNFTFDPTNLNYMLGLGVTSSLPILVHMNDGRWADCCTPNSSGGWGDSLLDFIAAQANTTVLSNTGVSDYAHDGGSNYFSLSRLNTVYRTYKKRNVQAAAAVIASWAAANPSMFVGVSLDSETLMPNAEADYNPLTIEEWKQWLQNIGIYGPGGDYFGTGRVPAFTEIAEFNNATGQSFESWDSMQPPATITPGDPFGEEWERWRITLIYHSVSDETSWIAEAGVNRSLIYGHQTPRLDDYGFADDVMTETAANGAGGVTFYGWDPADYGEITSVMRASGQNNWGNFELNPLTNDSAVSYNNLVTLYDEGIKVICPNSWESDEAVKDQYAIFDSPDWGDTFGDALNQFLSDYGDTPRKSQPAPSNAGSKVYDFYDSFPGAATSGPDNHLEATGTVGNVIRKSIYSHVNGSITYTATLPSGTLNLWASLGIKDGAGIGGEVQFQIKINGTNLLGEFFHLEQNYWVWKRWVPIMVDVTQWAGSNVTIELLTTGNQTWGWTMWGAPAIYLDDGAEGNLALGAPVSLSSGDGSPLTNGVVSEEGWVSDSHDASAAAEWAVVDLGSAQSVGKVVLFSRGDFGFGGFPTAFDIQGSNDSTTWTDLVVEQDCPGANGGDGQIFAFEPAMLRYIRVVSSVLSGVGGETGYRFILSEIEVFAG